jgi:uncharacterized protein (TIGR02266 family)
MPERRRNLRAVVRLEVKPGSESIKRPPFYVTYNVSSSGLYLITTDPFPEKTQIKLNFQLPGDSHVISVIAEVVWCREKDERPPYYPGMGVIFTEIKDEDKARIDKFVREHIAEEKIPPQPSTVEN